MTIVLLERPRLVAAMHLLSKVIRDELQTQTVDHSALGARCEKGVEDAVRKLLTELGADVR